MESFHITEHLSDPDYLEQRYREDPHEFEDKINGLGEEWDQNLTVRIWKARLAPKSPKRGQTALKKSAFLPVLLACLFGSLLLQIPNLFPTVHSEPFYMKNALLIGLAALSMYMLSRHRPISWKRTAFITGMFLTAAVFINLLPEGKENGSIQLSSLHLPLMGWCLLGIAFTGDGYGKPVKRMEFLRFNGDLAILTAILLAAGVALTVMTIGLFEAIGVKIEEFYLKYVVVTGVVSAPVVASWMADRQPALANKIAPVVAGIFTPLVLVTLTVFLAALPFTGKDLFEDREFLLVFNAMLLGVTALVVFVVSGARYGQGGRRQDGMLLALTALALIIDGIALSAILYRLGNYGLTPNRMAVLGSNLLLAVHQVLLMVGLVRQWKNRSEPMGMVKAITVFLPVYALWTLIVIFLFPILFGIA